MCQRTGADQGANTSASTPRNPEAAPLDQLGVLAREVANLQQRIEQDLGRLRAQVAAVRSNAGEPAALVAHAGAAFAV